MALLGQLLVVFKDFWQPELAARLPMKYGQKEVIQMEIQVNKLREVFDLLKPVVPRKSAVAAWTHILLQEGKAIAGDGEVYVAMQLPGSHRAADATVRPGRQAHYLRTRA